MPIPDVISSALNTARQAFASSIVYRRGANSVAITSAGIGSTRTFIETAEAGRLEVRSRDYLIAPADLDFGDGPTEPRDGDRIEETRDGKTYTYQVVTIQGETPWRWSDPYRKQFRVHTQHVATS